jgi:hypothetical protein
MGHVDTRIFLHSDRASFRIRRRNNQYSPLLVTTSTRFPRTCSGSSATNKSMALSSVASPWTTAPNTRTLRAPCFSAIRRISSRLSCKRTSIGFFLALSDHAMRYLITSQLSSGFALAFGANVSRSPNWQLRASGKCHRWLATARCRL